MAETFEQVLRQAMTSLGRLVEQLIGKARLAKVQVESRSGVQPIFSVESQLTYQRIRDLVESATQGVISNSIPNLKDQMAIEVCEGPPQFGPRMLGLQAQGVICVDIGGQQTLLQGDPTRGFVLRAQPARLPFANSRFNYVVGRMTTSFQSDMMRVIHELGRILSAGAQGIIVDYHPYGLYARRGTNRVRSAESGIRKFEDYYRFCRLAGLRVVDLKESFIDEEMRSFFKENEINAYRSLKGTPFLVFLFVYKPKKK